MIEVRPAAIAANVARMHDMTETPVMGIVKANGYGHGAVVAARAMVEGGATWLGVVDIAEALALRESGIDVPVLAWLHSADADFAAAAAAGVDVGVSSVAQLEAAAAAGATVHAKVDTGLGRNGVPFSQWQAFVDVAAALVADGLVMRGLFSHIAGSGVDLDRSQIDRFATALRIAEPLGATVRHLAASAAALDYVDGRHDLVRVGIAAYGIHPEGNAPGAPLGGEGAAALGLVPAMRVTSTATDGVVAIGYRDGLLPSIGAPVLVDGAIAHVAAMDAATLTLDVPVSGEAVLLGDPAVGEPSVDDWAHAASTIGYEVVTRMPADAERRVVDA